MKSVRPSGIVVVVAIYVDGKKDSPREQYVLTEHGVVTSEFEYPPLTNMPAAPIDFPAYLSDEDRAQWYKDKARAVIKYLLELTGVKE